MRIERRRKTAVSRAVISSPRGGERMKRTERIGLCELAIALVVSAFVLSMTSPGSMAGKNDWDIAHNEESVPNGGDCHIFTWSGTNHVEGTFEWEVGPDPDISFEYTYDDIHYLDAPADWYSPFYVFDFWTSWNTALYPYGDYFRIVPDHPNATVYYCNIVLP